VREGPASADVITILSVACYEAGGRRVSKATALVRDSSRDCIIRAPGISCCRAAQESFPLLTITQMAMEGES